MSRDGTAPRNWFVLLWIALLAGCGASAYEDRLARTDERNRYLAKLDEDLGPYWNHAGYQIWLRPPIGMVEIAAPQKPKSENGEEVEMPPDLRQEFGGVPLNLPGVIQTWEGNVPGAAASKYRVYVLGNHSRFISSSEDTSNEPKNYFGDLENVLGGFYGVTLTPGDSGSAANNNEKFRIQIPATERFAVPRTFAGVHYVPAAEGQVPFNAWLYEHSHGEMQCAVLMLAPPDSPPALRVALLTSLETIRVSNQKPRVQAGAAGGSSNTGGAPPPTF
jgi:hypothetical protein